MIKQKRLLISNSSPNSMISMHMDESIQFGLSRIKCVYICVLVLAYLCACVCFQTRSCHVAFNFRTSSLSPVDYTFVPHTWLQNIFINLELNQGYLLVVIGWLVNSREGNMVDSHCVSVMSWEKLGIVRPLSASNVIDAVKISWRLALWQSLISACSVIFIFSS